MAHDETTETVEGLVVREEAQEHPVAAQVRAASAQLELTWAKERIERAKWDAEDRVDMFYARLVAQMAAAWVAEGAAGTRPRADQIASHAVEYADAVMAKLKSKGHFKKRVDPEPVAK